jgi:hypothetical protein
MRPIHENQKITSRPQAWRSFCWFNLSHNAWVNEKKKRKEGGIPSWPSRVCVCVCDTLIILNSYTLLTTAVFHVSSLVSIFMTSRQMIIFCEHSSDFGWRSFTYAVVLFVVVISQTLILQQYQRFNTLTSAKIKTAVVGLIYKKVKKKSRNFQFLHGLLSYML